MSLCICNLLDNIDKYYNSSQKNTFIQKLVMVMEQDWSVWHRWKPKCRNSYLSEILTVCASRKYFWRNVYVAIVTSFLKCTEPNIISCSWRDSLISEFGIILNCYISASLERLLGNFEFVKSTNFIPVALRWFESINLYSFNLHNHIFQSTIYFMRLLFLW